MGRFMLLRKRKRHVLEEEEEISDGEMAAWKVNDAAIPEMSEFEEDKTGPNSLKWGVVSCHICYPFAFKS